MPQNNTAVAKPLPGSLGLINDIEQLKSALVRYRDHAHILNPFCRTDVNFIPPGWKVSVRATMISTIEDSGEVFHFSKKSAKVALTTYALRRLQQLAGLKWLWTKKMDVDVLIDSGKVDKRGNPIMIPDPRVVQYQACAQIMDLDGTYRELTDGYHLDLRDDTDQAKSYSSELELAQARKNIDQLAFTKARNRVIRGILGIQSSYKPEELQRPFVILKMVPDMNVDNKLIQLALQAKALQVEDIVFGYLRAGIDEDKARHMLEAGDLRPGMQIPTLPPVRVDEPLNLPPLPEEEEEEQRRQTEADLAALEAREARDALIRRIEDLYTAKKGMSRSQLSPDKPPLEDLSDESLRQIEAALGKLPALRDLI
jgi:hypothetical protein